jgi:hypothetical protein
VTPRFYPVIHFEEFWPINLALEPCSVVLKVLKVFTGDFKLSFLNNQDMVNFLSLLKKVLPSFERLLFQIVTELNDRVLGQGSEARESCHELGYL